MKWIVPLVGVVGVVGIVAGLTEHVLAVSLLSAATCLAVIVHAARANTGSGRRSDADE